MVLVLLVLSSFSVYGLMGDFNSDNCVKYDDFLLFSTAYLNYYEEGIYEEEFDLDKDNKIDLNDFLIFADGYEKCEEMDVKGNTIVKNYCGNDLCDLDETCISCSEDCGGCNYGMAGNNKDSVCGFSWEGTKDNRWIRGKKSNIDISFPEDPMKIKINEWVYANSDLYNQIKSGQYDGAVNKIFQEVLNQYNRGAKYWMTFCPCYYGAGCYGAANAPTTSYSLLEGSSGNCVDWSALLVSLFRTMDIPRERVFMICYGVPNTGWNPGHCVAVYKSDSDVQWILDITCFMGKVNKLNELGNSCSCANVDWSHWANDEQFGWGLNGVVC